MKKKGKRYCYPHHKNLNFAIKILKVSDKISIAIVGGTGIHDEKEIKDANKINVSTPYGNPSDVIIIGNYEGRNVAFLPRHGITHTIPPHKINFRANIEALNSLGVERIILLSAVGSLNENFKPGDIIISDQFIDFTKQRIQTFYDGNRVCHVSMADPFCPELRNIAIDVVKKLNFSFHGKGTYLCIEGPRFSTRAESKFFRNFADVIGMTLCPEATLAREREICCLNIATVTDYDVWAEKPVSIDDVIKVMNKNVEKIKNILKNLIRIIPDKRHCECGKALSNAYVD